MRRFSLCLTLSFVFLAGFSGRCEAQIPVTDAAHIAVSVWNEIERYAQAVEDYLSQIEQIYNQYEQIQYQLQALEKLDFHNWRDLSPAFARLLTLVDESDAVLYDMQQLEDRFYETFPEGERYTSYADDSWLALYRTMETLRVSLQSIHEITSSDELDLENLSAIEAEIEGARGHEEVLEGIGDLLSWTAKQGLLAERINAANANAEAVARAYEINEAARSRESYTAFLEDTVVGTVDAAYDESTPAFRALPSWMAP
jgi:P-type conjugative transfer protein TrbJ